MYLRSVVCDDINWVYPPQGIIDLLVHFVLGVVKIWFVLHSCSHSPPPIGSF
jgi:hypothetical protein